MSKCGCSKQLEEESSKEKTFYTVLEALTDKMLDDGDIDLGEDSPDVETIEKEHGDFQDQIDDLKEAQSALVLICSSLIVVLYDKNIIDRNAMRQLTMDTDRLAAGGLDFKGSMDYLRDLLTGKMVPSVHDLGDTPSETSNRSD